MDARTLDQAQLARLYADQSGPLRRRLTALTRDSAVAEDLAQEAFLRLIQEVHVGRIPDEPAAWLNRVACNLAASRGRHLAVVARHDATLARQGTVASPESALLEAEDGRALDDAMGGLAETDRHALLLAAHGYRNTEIADWLGRTNGATRTMLCRARNKVRARMLAGGAW